MGKEEKSELNSTTSAAIELKLKRQRPESSENSSRARKMPKRAAACSDFKDKLTRISKKDYVCEVKREVLADDEVSALQLTSGLDDSRPNRRLSDFVFHDSAGTPMSIEMLKFSDLFISGRILPLEENKKFKGIKCDGFGRVESWSISGYEEGSPIIWVSTENADYDCIKPALCYKKLYNLFFEKARACIEVYKKLSSGENPNLTLDELLSSVARSLSNSKIFSSGMAVKDFILSHGAFIYDELIGLDATSKENDQKFCECHVLVALRDDKKKRENSLKEVKNKSLKIGENSKIDQPDSSPFENGEIENLKLTPLMLEEKHWQMINKKRNNSSVVSNRFYIKINEDEIANDYPLPAYYLTSLQETDEFLIFGTDNDSSNPDDFPKSMLHNWSFYNSDTRLVSLELLPMKPCAEIDVTIYGSGTMTADDGSWLCLDDTMSDQSPTCAGAHDNDGIPIYLSSIKEWMIEFGSSMVSISIRTDLAWYRLGKPSKQYGPWYGPVLKSARLGIKIIMLLKEQTRVARLSYAEIIKKVSELDKNDPAFISLDALEVDRYVVVHGQILLQQFAEYPDATIKKCAFVSRLRSKMEEKHHTKWLMKKKSVLLKKEVNSNPRAVIAPVVSKRKAMQATTTRLINRVWGEFYSRYVPEELKEGLDGGEMKDNGLVEEEDSEEYEEVKPSDILKSVENNVSTKSKMRFSDQEVMWNGEPVGKTLTNQALYMCAFVYGEMVNVGNSVLLETDDIYFVEYMFESSDLRKMAHGRLLQRGAFTILGNTANQREVFMTNTCVDLELSDIKNTVTVKMRLMPWGPQYRKENADYDKLDRIRAEERKNKGLDMEFYCKSLYWPEKGAFFSLPYDSLSLGTGICNSCRIKETQSEIDTFWVNISMGILKLKGVQYFLNDFVYVSPHSFVSNEVEKGTNKSGRNIGLKAYAVCQLIDIELQNGTKPADPESAKVKVRRFFRPEDISAEQAYLSDLREVYYSEQILVVPVSSLEGKCEVRKKHDLPSLDGPALYAHIFLCDCLYDPDNGTVKQLPGHIKLSSLKEESLDDAKYKDKRGGNKRETEFDGVFKQNNASRNSPLATLDIFAGCGGLSEGLQQSGATTTKWAIEYEEPAGEAFRFNHPEGLMFVDNCNVILRAIMSASGDAEDCISTPEAADLASKLDEKIINQLPRPGEVDFINGGPPCQGFSGMNRFNQSSWSKIQCEMILAFLSFAEYFRPKYFLFENVRNFVSFNKGQTFRLTLASLLEMGYQVRFGVLQAGAYGVPQSRKRAFIWASSPKETLPEWPEPMHVFSGPDLKIRLSKNANYAAVRNTAAGALFRPITVRDTIGDLPAVRNGASAVSMQYGEEPQSWYQRIIQNGMPVLNDHISKEMNEINLIRCSKIPKRPGADWRDLPDEKVQLSSGQSVDLIPRCLPNTAERHNQWKGLYGRLDWEGNFPTSITDPQPMGKVGMCFHPEQDRILTVRECARSQGFSDSYKFAGSIQQKHRQIGNAVPPPLAFALGRKLKEAVDDKLNDKFDNFVPTA